MEQITGGPEQRSRYRGRAMDWTIMSSNPGRGYSFPHGPGRLWVLPSLLFTGSFVEINLSKRHATHSPTTRDEESMVVYLYSPYTPTWRGVLDKFTFYPDNSLVRFLFNFKGQYRSAGLLFKCQPLGKTVTSQWILIRKIHHSGLEVEQQETRPGKHVHLAFYNTFVKT